MNLETFVLLSLVLFALGLYAVMARRNLIAVLIGVELMLNAASLNFMAFNRFLPVADHSLGQVFVLFIIGLAAAEVAIALSIILVVYRERKRIDIDDITELKG